jgi:putative PIN family toxin of toxin-antitoxin system
VRIVIDTSVVVSAALKDRVPEEVILFVVGKPEFTWVASTEIISEYLTVLMRGKFNLPGETVQNWQNLFERRVTLVEVLNEISFPRDQKDAKFLACAISAEADYLITGDRDFDDAHKTGATTIISVSDFKRLIVENW